MSPRRSATLVAVAILALGCTPKAVGAKPQTAPPSTSHAKAGAAATRPATGAGKPTATGAKASPAATPASVPALARPAASGRPAHASSDTVTMTRITRITGNLSSKSVVASGTGVVFAQNMMYRHTITVIDVRKHTITATISDAVNLRALGATTAPAGVHHGAPVEASFTADGKYAYVSNYSMYGSGFGPEGSDQCRPHVYDDSYVYRVNVATRTIDQAIRVGSVPKFLSVTPDGAHVVVSNWCDYSVSIIDTAKAQTVKEIPIGRFPRGIAITADSKTAYVAVMGSSELAVVDLTSYKTARIFGVGSAPRHLVLAPGGRWLYITVNGAGIVEKLDTRTRKIVARISTGSQPRSMTIAPDGKSLYVVNYASDTVTKVRASDMHVLQTVHVDHHPIGITYAKDAGEVWVACYSGSIIVFKDS